MKAPAIFGAVLIVFCLAESWAIRGQQRQLAALRAEQQSTIAQNENETKNPPAAASLAGASEADTSSSRLVVTPELLRLRAEVTRLEARRRELASVAAQNAGLHAQLASLGTNGATGIQLPPGYIRASEARLVGYGSPADTMQSFLWAIRNHDIAHLLQAFSPEVARHFPNTNSMDDAFQGADALVGMAIIDSHQMPDGSVEAKMQITPDLPDQPVKFRQINGEWKIFGMFGDVNQ